MIRVSLNKKVQLTVSIVLLLFLNLGAGMLVKISPMYYEKPLFLIGLILLVLGFYSIQTVMWLFLGKHYQISYIYPLLSVNYVLSLFVGVSVFHEEFVFRRLTGAMIILCGVTLLSFSKHRNEVRDVEA